MDEEMMGRDREDKLEPEAIENNSKAMKWLDNFWYHYKWHTIIGVFFLTVVIVCLVQMLDRPAYDTTLIYAGAYRMDEEEKEAFDKLLSGICPVDYDDNGEKSVNFLMYQVYAEKDILAEQKKAEAAGEQFVFNTKYNAEEQRNFLFFTQTGEGAVCLVNPDLYHILQTEGRLRSVSDLYPEGELPPGVTEDGCGVTLGETDFYVYNPAARVLPEDLILCLLKPTINADEQDYAVSEKLFCALVEDRIK